MADSRVDPCTPKVSRRAALATLLAASAGALIAGCAPAATPTMIPAPTEPPLTATPAPKPVVATRPPAPAAAATPTTAAVTKPAAASAPTTSAATATTAPAAVANTPARINLNTGTRTQFLTIPNVGDRMVREFEEYRPYTTIGQFRREIGKYVSAEQVRAYERYLFVPVDPNRADAETLQQLPGVTAAIAQQIIATRPYASLDTFVARLSDWTSAEHAAAARALLTGPT